MIYERFLLRRPAVRQERQYDRMVGRQNDLYVPGKSAMHGGSVFKVQNARSKFARQRAYDSRRKHSRQRWTQTIVQGTLFTFIILLNSFVEDRASICTEIQFPGFVGIFVSLYSHSFPIYGCVVNTRVSYSSLSSPIFYAAGVSYPYLSPPPFPLPNQIYV